MDHSSPEKPNDRRLKSCRTEVLHSTDHNRGFLCRRRCPWFPNFLAIYPVEPNGTLSSILPFAVTKQLDAWTIHRKIVHNNIQVEVRDSQQSTTLQLLTVIDTVPLTVTLQRTQGGRRPGKSDKICRPFIPTTHASYHNPCRLPQPQLQAIYA